MSDAKSQRSRILALLVEARGGWVGLPEILELKVAQYSARICELRKLGFRIQNRTETDAETGARHSWFRLAASPAAVGTPKPTPKRDNIPDTSRSVAIAWEDRQRITGLPLFDMGKNP